VQDRLIELTLLQYRRLYSKFKRS